MSLEVYGKQIPENADAYYVLGENIDVLYVFGELVWQKQKYYYIAFNANSGTGAMPPQTMPIGVATALAHSLYSKLGYLFSGWSESADGEKQYSDGEAVTDIAAAGQTLDLYAVWAAITWYAKFNANGGLGSMANQTHRYDTPAALAENAFTRKNYSFAGWGTSPNGDIVYSDCESVVNLSNTHGGIVNLYALWQALDLYFIQTGVFADENALQSYRQESECIAWNEIHENREYTNSSTGTVDVTPYQSVKITYAVAIQNDGGQSYCSVGFGAEQGSMDAQLLVTGIDMGYNFVTEEFDISNLTGEMYLTMKMKCYSPDDTNADVCIRIKELVFLP